MIVPSLPNNLAGDWIWQQDHERKDNRRIYARKQFIIEKTFSTAELRICAIPFYHVYINGEHVGYGPAFPTRSNCYVDVYDVTQYLESGLNTIAIAVMDQTAASWHAHPYPPKFWCQMFADDTQCLVTGTDWKITEADCNSVFQPRCHYGMEKCEEINFSSPYNGWQQPSYDDKAWDNARAVDSFPNGKPEPVLPGVSPCFWSESDAFEIFESGNYRDKFAVAYYTYSGFPELKPGTYAAQSYAFSMHECDVEIKISSDDPFAVFCNNAPVAFGQNNRSLDRYERPHSPRIGMDVLQTAKIHLQKGWNSFLCYQDAAADCMGLMLLFPGIKKGALTFRRESSNVALTGWKLYGPMRMPLPFASASFSLDDEPDAVSFLPLEEHINDISAYLDNCEFQVATSDNPSCLKQGDFAIYDLGCFRYGFPLLDVSGSAGDIVDITCGIRLENKIVKTIGTTGRMTDTLILSGGTNTWMRMVPRGARYVMISVRRSATGIFPIFRFVSSTSELGNDNAFSCSDELINSVWKRAVDSLQQCTVQNIIDDPCGRRCQLLPEAYIYSRALYSLFGGKSIAEKALREFADSQLENGMILKIAPSGVYSYAPDTALFWIIWLEDHWMHTGDLQLLQAMEPCLTRLLNFFRMLPPEGDVLLPSERAGHCIFFNKSRKLAECGIFTMLNALYFKALTAAMHLYIHLGMKNHVIECSQITSRLAEELEKYTCNPKTGIYADSYNGERSASSIHTNIIMLYSGMISVPKNAETLLRFCCSNPNELLAEYSSPFFYFILDTLFSYGRRELAMQLIQQSAALSMDRACIYENDGNPHIPCIIAADLIIREILGVRPSAPGASQIYFNPACDYLQSCKCKLPSGEGRISVAWDVNDSEVNVHIDSNAQLDVLPVIPPKYGSTFDLGNYVNMLDPNS